MNNLKVFGLLLSLFSLLSCNEEIIDPVEDTNGHWQVIDTGFQGTISEMRFVSADTGFALGSSPDALLKTVDGGGSWEVLPFPASLKSAMTSFYPVTGKTVLAARDTVYRSTDGGDTWAKLSLVDGTGVRQLAFTGSKVGYACTGLGVYKTADAGESWRMVKQKSLAYDAVQFIDAENGFASGGKLVELNADKIIATYGVLARTTDGGETWTDLETGDWSTNTQNFKKITGIHFVNPSHGYLTTFERELLRTSDAGGTWEVVNSQDINDPYAVPIFRTEGAGFLKSGNIIFRTEDGGRALIKNYYNEQHEIIGLYSTPDHQIFAFGRAGFLLRRK